jgi:hypothetical protein
MVYVVQSYWACFGLYPSSCMWKTKYHNVSETGSVSVLRWMGQDKPTQLGPLERDSLNYWTTYKTMDRVQNKPNSSACIKLLMCLNLKLNVLNYKPLHEDNSDVLRHRSDKTFCKSYTGLGNLLAQEKEQWRVSMISVI